MSRAVLVASSGGHLDELYDLAPRLLPQSVDRLWVTPATPHTRFVLAEEAAEWVPPIRSREGGRALRRLPSALALVRRLRPDLVVSTGAAMAAPYLVAARMLGVETHYVESATRLAGPSMTGRIMARVPGTHLHHQAFTRPVAGWHRVSSVFDTFKPGPVEVRPVKRVIVVLGTERYPFPRILDLVRDTFGRGVDLLVQTGHTPVRPVGDTHRQWVPYDELVSRVAQADLVVTHAGVGSVLTALRLGKHPVVVPRVSALGEHVDDHQVELADMLQQRGLATVVPDGGGAHELLQQAAGRSNVRCWLPTPALWRSGSMTNGHEGVILAPDG